MPLGNENPADIIERHTKVAAGLKGALSNDTETIARMFTGVLESHGWQDSLLNLYVKQSLCEGYYEWNRLDDCRQLLPWLERGAVNKRLPGLLIPVRLTQACIYMVEGRPHLAHNTVDETLEAAAKLQDAHWLKAVQAFKACLFMREGNNAQAKKELAKLGLSAKDMPTFNQEAAYLAFARLLGKQRKESEAMRLLELLKPQSQREQLISSLVEISILQALLEYQRGQRTAALRCLHEALAIGEQNGYVRSFVDEGTAMADLLAMYANHRSALTEDRE